MRLLNRIRGQKSRRALRIGLFVIAGGIILYLYDGYWSSYAIERRLINQCIRSADEVTAYIPLFRDTQFKTFKSPELLEEVRNLVWLKWGKEMPGVSMTSGGCSVELEFKSKGVITVSANVVDGGVLTNRKLSDGRVSTFFWWTYESQFRKLLALTGFVIPDFSK